MTILSSGDPYPAFGSASAQISVAERDASNAVRDARDPAPANAESKELREAFTSFVGRTFFGQLIQAMRTSVGKPAYFHGGQAEEIFRGELDRILGEKMARQSGKKLADPMFRHQFPRQAERDRQAEVRGGSAGAEPIGLDSLATLHRR